MQFQEKFVNFGNSEQHLLELFLKLKKSGKK